MNAQSELSELIERAAPAPIRLDEMFTGQAARTPDAIAVMRKGDQTSYAVLDRLANRFANRLLNEGLAHGDRVAIALPRSVDLIAAMIGSMKIGCVYIPVDTALPAERIAFILHDSGARAVLAHDPEIAPKGFAGTIIDGAGVEAAETAPTVRTRANDPAYILYTSGSTGQPKGVLLGHNACHYIAASIRHFRSGELQRVAAVTSISFDPSVFEFFAPLACGGTIILKDDALQPFTADERPTLMQGVPTALRQLARANAIPDSVQIINSGGETLTRAIADEIFARSAVRRIYNHYGPTEASICTTISAVHRDSDIAPDVGRPVAGAELLIRDMETGEPVADGEPGEIRIGGPVLALGYVNDPRLTEARFVIDAHTMTRVYRTGDFGRINAQGRLEFLGRADDQVKLRGHRIELAEIDDAMIAADRVSDAGAVVVRSDDGKSRLIGFACLDDPGRMGASARQNLFFALRRRLPASMVPHRIEWLETIPRLPSGKVDRARLCQIARSLPNAVSTTDSIGSADLARTIGAMFGEALSREPLGQDEDFFALGGDSLMCVDIAIRLEEMLERPVAVNLLAHHSTPRELVAVLSLQKNIHSLITREGNPNGEPIFLTPGIGGSDTDYDSLCPTMSHRRLVKLHALPISDRLIEEPTIDTLISTLVPMIEKEQPEGRITLLGYSVGGVVAYALARDLEKRGRKTRLIIIDSQISHCDAKLSDWTRLLKDQIWPSIRDDGLKFSLHKLARSLRFWFPRTIGRFQRGHIPDFLATEHREYGSSLIKAETALRYTPRTSPTLLIVADRAHKSDHFRNPVGFAGWRRLLVGDEISIRHMPATHSELIRRPVVHRLGTLIEGWLAEETEH